MLFFVCFFVSSLGRFLVPNESKNVSAFPESDLILYLSLPVLVRARLIPLLGNYIVNVPDAIGRLSALRLLDLSRNCLERLSVQLARLPADLELDLSGNPALIMPPAVRFGFFFVVLRFRGVWCVCVCRCLSLSERRNAQSAKRG